ncbi:PilT protein domain protein [Actinomyces sp. Chiba101]|uniref:type II toxin-antitoxin system VapC family toxin n=1 Tax=Actinomyces TaxID=1654 RepID=UPI000974EE93|nr:MULTISPECIES: type II toxin-antitoxin system VapC family toxin [Actinomyces]BAW93083.1 PilT protein domain protein [Actinomyces sp. Chiba101]GAV95688.1 PilT protein domain protein [Actinomyces denticolens]SUU05147.1 PIN domain [Actinomyces denticolens]
MGVTYLLDTHVLLWLIGQPSQIPEHVVARLEDLGNSLLVSAVSALEIAQKTRRGKFDSGDLVSAWDRRIASIGADHLEITRRHALHAGMMDWEHRDPFDRLLVAQSELEGAVLVTADRKITSRDGLRLLSW